tara:strand:+ start:1725 stop:2417 length:693 start_codon:yes stop_codon:yes gene_type:complete
MGVDFMKVCNNVLIDPNLHEHKNNFNPTWYYADDGFDKDEVEKIKELKKYYSFNRGTTFGKTPETTDEKTRQSEIFWLQESHMTQWIYNRLSWHINRANAENWGFILQSMEQIQYSRYKGPEVLNIRDKSGIRSHRDMNRQKGHYDWHYDLGRTDGNDTCRKVSAIVQLSDSNDYTGGEVETHCIGGRIIHGKKMGCIIVFPSFVLHKVNPVSRGIRESLVIWCHGPKFQ